MFCYLSIPLDTTVKLINTKIVGLLMIWIFQLGWAWQHHCCFKGISLQTFISFKAWFGPLVHTVFWNCTTWIYIVMWILVDSDSLWTCKVILLDTWTPQSNLELVWWRFHINQCKERILNMNMLKALRVKLQLKWLCIKYASSVATYPQA